MNASCIIPTLMVRNEERFIAAVLHPLTRIFGRVLLADTGSTDDTPQIVQTQFPSVEFIEYGSLAGTELTQVRRELGQRAERLGYDWTLLVDGDELYNMRSLRALLACEPPPTMRTGFVAMLTLDEDTDGTLWELTDNFNRQALFSVHEQWHGIYPFDTPVSFDHPAGFFYFPLPPDLRYHALHLHPLVRSRRDGDVLLRDYKRRKFSLQDKVIPRGPRFDFTAWTQEG